VDRQGTYQFSDEDRKRLIREYVRLVSQNGVACSANVCGNRKLQQAVLSAAKELSNDKASLEQVAQFEKEFREAFRPQPAAKTSSVKPKQGRPASLADLLKIRLVSMEEFAARTRRYVEENAWIVGFAALVSMAFGSVIALWMRKRPGLPPVVLEIRQEHGSRS
jgi:cobalamin biosynthesis Mg chelatase CobN